MAQITEDLVWNETHSATNVSNWDRTTASDDSKASFATITQGDGNITFGLTNLTHTPTSITSVQMIHESQANASVTVVIDAQMRNSSDSQLNQQYTSFAGTSDTVVTDMTVHTTNGGTSAAWTENDINTLRIYLKYHTTSGPSDDSYIDHFYVRVIYNAEAGLINVPSGIINLTSGILKLSL